MDKKFAIFDMDGTLIESMTVWNNLAGEFLLKKNIKITKDVVEALKPMTITESARYFIEKYHFTESAEDVGKSFNESMEQHYLTDIEVKAKVPKYLQTLKDNGCKMCVASSTSTPLIKACLKRLGILDYFDFVLSCDDLQCTKITPTIYLEAIKQFGCTVEETAVYEDSLLAMQTAKKAGFYVVGVFDHGATDSIDKIKQTADEFIDFY